MSNQDYIDYENNIAAQNTAAIEQLIQSNTNLNQNIAQTQNQIMNNTAQINQLQIYNTYITAVIGFLTNQDMIAYQNSIAAQNTATITQLTQAKINLNQYIIQLQNIIINNTDQIGVLETNNTYIKDTIALIPIS